AGTATPGLEVRPWRLDPAKPVQTRNSIALKRVDLDRPRRMAHIAVRVKCRLACFKGTGAVRRSQVQAAGLAGVHSCWRVVSRWRRAASRREGKSGEGKRVAVLGRRKRR